MKKNIMLDFDVLFVCECVISQRISCIGKRE